MAKEELVFATHTRSPLSLYLKEVIQEALKPYFLDAEVIEIPGSRVISHVNSGYVDGDLARVGNFKDISDTDTSNYLRVNESIALIEIVMVTLADTEVVHPITWESINHGKVAFQRGSKTMRMHLNKQNRYALSSSLQVLEMVEKNVLIQLLCFLLLQRTY